TLAHVCGGRFEPLLNVGVACNANDVSRSIVRWGVGGTYQVLERLSTSVVFLGRNELAAQSDPIPTPFFFQIERNDIYDASVGFRWRFAGSAFLGVNALVPLNSDGFRPDAIPPVEASYAFSAPADGPYIAGARVSGVGQDRAQEANTPPGDGPMSEPVPGRAAVHRGRLTDVPYLLDWKRMAFRATRPGLVYRLAAWR